MKKIIYSAAAMALVFFAASCQQEKLEPLAGGNTVTYTVQVPELIKTKAIGDEVTDINTVYYEVYRAAEVEDLSKTPVYEGNKSVSGTQVSFDLEFVKNQVFVVLFWAQSSALVLTDENPDGMYNIDDLREIQLVNPGAANNGAAQVFAGSDRVTNCASAANGNVTLTRPVSQLNIYTTKESLSFGTGITLDKSFVKVSGLYKTYNVAKGAAVLTPTTEAYEYALNDVPETTDADQYAYVAMNYVGFAPNNGTTVNVDFTIKTSEAQPIVHSVSNVPLKPNYRTNILGNLITASDNYTVTLDAEWGDAGKDMEVLADGLVKNINGDYEVSSANGLAHAINNFFAQGGDFYLTAAEYDMTGYVLSPVTVAAGKTLNLYGEVPAVTRSSSVSFGSVTITGLTKPLIKKVEADASLSISGVEIPAEENETSVLIDEIVEGATVVVSEVEVETIANTGEGNVVSASEVQNLVQLYTALSSGVKEINVTTTIVIEANQDVVIDLNGKTVRAVDTTESNFELIKNKGTLVIKNTAAETAEMTVEATINSGWNRYSAVIANEVGGNLSVEGDIILEHLGGTDMAYGIDNLTNGKGTSAVTTIDGATVKSPYRAVRQFLNGVEAINKLTVKKGSKLIGTNKSIFFHDPSTNANSGELVVEEGAELYGDVYLFVTAGSTEWPVRASIPVSSLKDGSKVITGNVPDGYCVVEINGTWTVTPDTSFIDFVNAVIENNGTYDGEGMTVKIVPASGDAREANKNFNVPARLQKYGNPDCYYAQYQLFGGLTDVNVSNVKFVFVPREITVMDPWNPTGATTNVSNVNGELQFVNTGKVTLTGCTFETVAVSPIKASELNITKCRFKDLKAYAIKDIYASAVVINENTFDNCNGGFWFADAPSGIQAKDNSFIEVGRRGAIQFSSTGDYKDTVIEITGNTVTGGAFLWQLNSTVTYDQVASILETGNNTYETAYVAGSTEPKQPSKIFYVSTEMKLEPTNSDALNAKVVSNVWDKTTGEGVITFDGPLTVIGEKAFQRVTNNTPSNWITSITLPEGLETIGNDAFAQCYSLTNITIPDSVTSIGQYAFQSCNAVTTVTIGSSVANIGSGAFYNCYEIKEIVCKAITPPALAGKYVFYGVSKDIKVVVPATALDTYKEAEHWKSFTNIVAE